MHPLVVRAAKGELPEWSCAGAPRREHMRRVADLMEHWARSLELDAGEVVRWRAAGYLHDVLRDGDPSELRTMIADEELRDLPDPVLHGPAAADRLEEEGVGDSELILAVAFHTIGHPRLGRLGRALYTADFLEPGRDFPGDPRAELRERMPHAAEEVVIEVARARIGRTLDAGRSLRRESVAFWNGLVALAGR